MRTCFVFIYPDGEKKAVPAGKLDYYPMEEAFIFQYGRKYLLHPKALPVDAANLPLSSEAWRLSSDNLGAIRDSAPDYWGRLVIMKFSENTELSEMDYLLAVNAERVGNLDFRSSLFEKEPERRPPQCTELPKLIIAAESLEKNEILTEDQRAELALLYQGSSLGGARPKCVVEDEDGLWLAKFPSRGDTFNNAKIEFCTMKIASACGINIPEMRMETVAGQDVLLVRRFDRNADGTRIGYLSALSLLGISEYDRDEFSYVRLAEKMRSFGAENDLPELFARISFNIICRNTDDHPRNHGFLVKNEKIVLSPAFDVTPTRSTAGISSTARLAMIVGKNGREGTLENLLSSAGSFGISMEEGKVIFEKQCETVTNTWRKIFHDARVSREDAEAFEYTFAKWGGTA